MADKPTKVSNFFEGRRRKAFLVAWSHLKTKAGESRIKMDLRLPLLTESTVGMNTAISEGFNVMSKQDSKLGRTAVQIEMEGMTLESFVSAEGKIPFVSSTGVKMQKLFLVPSGEGEKRQIDLHLVAYVPASQQLRDWAWEHLHAEFHLEAVYSQSEMEFEDEVAEEEAEEGETEEEPEMVAAPPQAGRKKSGPKDLAAYHAAHPN